MVNYRQAEGKGKNSVTLDYPSNLILTLIHN